MPDKFSCMRWSEAEVKDLVPGLNLYHVEKSTIWIVTIGQANDYTACVAKNCTDVEYASKHGEKIGEAEALKMFPILRKAHFKFNTE